MKHKSSIIRLISITVFITLTINLFINAVADENKSLNLGERILPVPKTAFFQDDGHFTWGGSMIKGEDEKYYLFYSRWPHEIGMGGWRTHSEVAVAVADHPLGPYKHQSVALKGRGEGYFDATTIHNPTIKKFNGKYYLYHMGCNAMIIPGESGKTPEDPKESLRQIGATQRIGVAVAASINGPWERQDEPVIDVTPGGYDSNMVTNPSVTYYNGKYIMIYKCSSNEGRKVLAVAFADSPAGPFIKYKQPISIDGKLNYPGEDPCVFTFKGSLYLIVSGRAEISDAPRPFLVMYTSRNGTDWKLAKNPLVSTRTVAWADGTREELADLERTQLYFDEDGEPAAMFCAATRGQRRPGKTFNIHIPLRKSLLHENSTDGKHLFILSGQSNMARMDENISFIPTIESYFGKDNVIIVKNSKGGQPIRRWYKMWKPANGEIPESTGDLYDLLMEDVNAAIEGENIKTVSFIWMQGEADAKQAHGEVYVASLRGLIDQLKSDLERKDINFVIGRISDFDMNDKEFPHWTIVRKAQVDVAEADPRGVWVNTDDLNDGVNKKGEAVENDLHCTKEGFKKLGERFAENAIELINKYE